MRAFCPPHVPWLAALLALAACEGGDGEAQTTKPAAEDEPAEPEAPPPPAVPSVEELDSPEPGAATVAWPRWRRAERRFEHETRTLKAAFGVLDEVTLVQLGEQDDSATLTYYGAALGRGEHEVLPATDETRAEHAGKDSDVATITIDAGGGRLLSTSGTVTITSAGDGILEGRIDATVRRDSKIDQTETPLRARFHAERSDWIDATLEHQAAIRKQLKNR